MHFSVMKFVKSKLRNRMKDNFLASYSITYIEKDIARDFDIESIINIFYECRNQLQMPKFCLYRHIGIYNYIFVSKCRQENM